jgi:hypothetical protein
MCVSFWPPSLFSIKPLIFHYGDSTLRTLFSSNHLPKALPPNTIVEFSLPLHLTMGIKFPHMNPRMAHSNQVHRSLTSRNWPSWKWNYRSGNLQHPLWGGDIWVRISLLEGEGLQVSFGGLNMVQELYRSPEAVSWRNLNWPWEIMDSF